MTSVLEMQPRKEDSVNKLESPKDYTIIPLETTDSLSPREDTVIQIESEKLKKVLTDASSLTFSVGIKRVKAIGGLIVFLAALAVVIYSLFTKDRDTTKALKDAYQAISSVTKLQTGFIAPVKSESE